MKSADAVKEIPRENQYDSSSWDHLKTGLQLHKTLVLCGPIYYKLIEKRDGLFVYPHLASRAEDLGNEH